MRIEAHFFVGDRVTVSEANMFTEFPEEVRPFIPEIFDVVCEVVGFHFDKELYYLVQVLLDEDDESEDALAEIMEDLEADGKDAFAAHLETMYEAYAGKRSLLMLPHHALSEYDEVMEEEDEDAELDEELEENKSIPPLNR